MPLQSQLRRIKAIALAAVAVPMILAVDMGSNAVADAGSRTVESIQLAQALTLAPITVQPEQASWIRDDLPAFVADLNARAERLATQLGGGQRDTNAAQSALARAQTVLPTDPQEAARQFRAAIRSGDRAATTLFFMAQAEIASGNFERALDTAALAIARAGDGKTAAASWFFAGRALEELDQDRRAVTAFRMGLSTYRDDGIAQRVAALEAGFVLRVTGIEADTDRASPSVCVTFNLSLPSDRALTARAIDLDSYLQIAPQPTDGRAFARGNRLCRDGLSFGTAYSVTVLAGVPAVDGEALPAAWTERIEIGDRSRSVAFKSTGYILPSLGSTGIPLSTINVGDVALELMRLPDRSIAEDLSQSNRIFRALSGYDRDYLAERTGETVWTGSVAPNADRNVETVTAIPVADMIGSLKPGVYALSAWDRADEPERWSDRATQWFVVSDLGIASYEGSDGLTVAVRSLSSIAPQAGVTVSLIARNQDLLAEAETDDRGLVTIDRGLLVGKGGAQPSVLLISDRRGAVRDPVSGLIPVTDFSFLDLNRAPFDLSDRGVGGREAPGPMDVFLYADRGVYRPGETARIGILLRDQEARAVEGLPVRVSVLRPDGVKSAEHIVADGGAGGRVLSVPFSRTARTGSWTVEVRVEPEGDPLASLQVQVEDIVPATIDLTVSVAQDRVRPGDVAEVSIKSDYLYGAPAANLQTRAELVIRQEAEPFADWRSHRFGLVEETADAVRKPIGEKVTDADGQAVFAVPFDSVPNTPQPLSALIRVEVLERSGRPVIETVKVPISTHPLSLGIRPLFGSVQEGDLSVGYREEAGFEVIAVDADGRRVAADSVRWRLILEERDYVWSRGSDGWFYDIIVTDRTVDSGTLSIATEHAARYATAQDWGHYRFEVFDPESGAASSIRFRSGWRESAPGAETPDTLEISLQGDRHVPGDTVRAFVRAPFAGTLDLLVATDRIVDRVTLPLPAEGREIALPVTADYGVGAYLLATAYRAGDRGAHMPARAIGVSHVRIDDAPRRLDIVIDTPQTMRPRQTVPVGLSLKSADGRPLSGRAYVTLAAVDEGVLSLTRYQTPDPSRHFHGQRKLGIKIRDLYGKLIDGRVARIGAVRSGGDEAAGAQRGAPDPNVEIVALFSGPVAVDADGRIEIPLDLPDFQGRLRLMVVGWTETSVGAADRGMTVRDPLVSQLALPRFLAIGDRAEVTLSLDPLDVPDGDYAISMASDGPVSVRDATRTVRLSRGRTAVETFALAAEGLGTANLVLSIKGQNGFSIQRQFSLGVRSPRLPAVRQLLTELSPGQSVVLDDGVAGDFLTGTAEATMSLSSNPPIDVAGLVRGLSLYPYGCLEQTTSRALPLLYLSGLADRWSLTGSGGATSRSAMDRRIADAISRTLEQQKYDGSFGLWSADADTDPWISAYAIDFLQRAQMAGHAVPGFALNRANDYLLTLVRSGAQAEPARLAAIAYAHFLTARTGISAPGADLGAARYLADQRSQDMPSAAALAHLGGALALRGDLTRARSVFASAVVRSEDQGRRSDDLRDYGSELRDIAAIIVTAQEAKAAQIDTAGLFRDAERRLRGTAWTSTQEKAWLVLAAATAPGGGPVAINVNGQSIVGATDPTHLAFRPRELAAGTTVKNAGTAGLWHATSVIGIPAQPESPSGVSEGYEINRRFLTAENQPADLARVTQGDRLIVLIEGQFTAAGPSQSLVVDLLPAGFEIENSRLEATAETNTFPWLTELTKPDQEEYRDDRYVAAFDLGTWQGWSRSGNDRKTFRLAYVVRAVTPGTFSVPAVAVEDMYKPSLRALGPEASVTIRKAQ